MNEFEFTFLEEFDRNLKHKLGGYLSNGKRFVFLDELAKITFWKWLWSRVFRLCP